MTSLARRLAALEEKVVVNPPPSEVEEGRVLGALRALAAGRTLGPRQAVAFDAWKLALAAGHTYPAILAGLSVDELRALIARWEQEENAISGLAVRDEIEREECECGTLTEEHDDDCPAGGELYREPGLAGNDVFIVEGRQERYGNKNAWLATR